MFRETSRRFDLSSRSLGHVMFSFAGTAQGSRSMVVDRGQLVSLFTVHSWALFFRYMASFTFLLVQCGSLISTLVLSSETECPVALQWSPTPVGMVRLVCSLKRFPSGRLVSPMYTRAWSCMVACYLVYDPTLLVLRRLVFRVYEDGT